MSASSRSWCGWSLGALALVLFPSCDGSLGEPLSPATAGGVSAGSMASVAAGSGASTTGPAGPPGIGVEPASDSPACSTAPARAPLRRLSRFEYNNTVRDLLGDTTQPARSFPSEEIGNGFGNDSDTQSVSSLLAEQYGTVAEQVALRATEMPAALAHLDPCTSSLTAATEAACARTIIERLASRAYRRPPTVDDTEGLNALYAGVRATSSFQVSLATVIEALLQSPDFLYRVELGAPDATSPARIRPTGDEMATRLSYLFWGTSPDEALRTAAQSGELSTSAGVLTHARRMLDDPRSRAVLRFFFDNLLPIASLAQLERDPSIYPAFDSGVGALMREETQTFLEYEIFSGSRTWPGALTAPYTFVNDALAKYYGMPPVVGAAFQKVPLDTTQRLGLLTQGGIMAGTTASNNTNPVLRGVFVARQLMCRPLALPSDPTLLAKIKPPDPYSGKTARERYGAHSRDPVCAACHQFMDPIGLTFENFDAIGLYRTSENGEPIDASGGLPGTPGTARNAVELARLLGSAEETQQCFASHWLEYAYGRSLDDASDSCLEERVQAAFKTSGYDVYQLLLDLTQTDAFLYLPDPT